MKCWNCGTQNQKTAKTCKKCGSDLTNPLEDEGKSPEKSLKTEGGISSFIWIILGILGVGLLIVLFSLIFSNPTQNDQAEPAEASSVLIPEIISEETKQAEAETATGGAAGTTESSAAGHAQGEGCDWNTCAWMDAEQCAECGGTWEDYGTEAYCSCSAEKWNSLDLEWCEYEGGTWLQDEERCTFLDRSASAAGVQVVSACADLFYYKAADDEAAYQTFKQSCKAAGGVDQCWDGECNLRICMCPDENNVSGSCDWVNGRAVQSELKCYDENGTCWLTLQPSSAVIDEGDGNAEPQIIVTTSGGQVFSSTRLTNDSSGCIYDEDQISCLISEDGAFNAADVEDIYLCMDLCCLNLDDLEEGNVKVQSGDCPASGNLEVWNFTLLEGVMTFELRNSMGWDVNTLGLFLDDAKGEYWTTMSCSLDNTDCTVMNCEGWAVYKSGYATMSFYYGSGDGACSVSGVRFDLPWIDPCGTGKKYCTLTGGCCSSGYSCCSCGCKNLDEDEDCSDVCN